ncbi:hypothetical protein LTR62_003376 [Meristemomyces frigidus]|uniref:Metal homeostatis protein bsd2 n=1 Tax=Meristemomyces frigidus TaxID=1508187 RepID=A0AAN7YGZ4_9PEZI|nr:hypothetical protein LTR62_003376 [Meristemomyces frigidus]
MGSRYQKISNDDEDGTTMTQSPTIPPTSPPPSFRSRVSSRSPSREEETKTEEERNLNDAFDAPSDDEADDEDTRDRRRLIPNEHTLSPTDAERPITGERRVTQLPVFTPTPALISSGRVIGNGSDGVFANINAKPRAGEDLEEKPPTYEQAAADATPPYWETTVLSPYHTTGNPDDVFVDGLLVGSVFSFVWNGLISMSFQLIGFLLTYLLHTTHAAKHGSRAGLGVTLVQYGFQMRYSGRAGTPDEGVPAGAPVDGVPSDPNKHNFDPTATGGSSGSAGSVHGVSGTDMVAYILMIAGWFILIRALSDFFRARRQEQLVRSSPDRGLGVAVVAEGEQPESSV